MCIFYIFLINMYHIYYIYIYYYICLLYFIIQGEDQPLTPKLKHLWTPSLRLQHNKDWPGYPMDFFGNSEMPKYHPETAVYVDDIQDEHHFAGYLPKDKCAW